MAEIEVDGVKVDTENYYDATVVDSFIDSAGLSWTDLSIKNLSAFGPMKIYFHVGTFEDVSYRNINFRLPKGLEIQVRVRAYDQSDVREKTEYDKGWRLKVTSARVVDADSRKKLELQTQKAVKDSKPCRIKIIPEGNDIIRATASNFHTREIQTFNDNKVLSSQRVRITATGKFTLIDLLTGNPLINAGRVAENIPLFEWDTNAAGIESLGIKYIGSRDLSLRLIHVPTGEVINFRLEKV